MFIHHHTTLGAHRGAPGLPRGAQGPRGRPWEPRGGPRGAMGPMRPMGGPCAPIGPMFPHWEKLFFRKSTKNSGMSTFGSKTKVVRTEILHILVPKPSRGDLYLTISRPSRIFPISSQSQFWDLFFKPLARRGNGSNFRSKFGPFLKIQSGTLDFWIFFVNSAGGEKG